MTQGLICFQHKEPNEGLQNKVPITNVLLNFLFDVPETKE